MCVVVCGCVCLIVCVVVRLCVCLIVYVGMCVVFVCVRVAFTLLFVCGACVSVCLCVFAIG